MAMATGAMSAVEVIRERLTPVLDTLDETVRQGRRAIVRRQHDAEDVAAAAALLIRRKPLRAVLFAAGAGVLVGGLIGFGLGQPTRPRT